jgi:protein-S-isoprenylcysteine O-methyltransferase Ste14
LIIAVVNLGQNISVGLPKERTQLVASGVYAVSRNPIYLAIFIMMIGSCIYVLNPINWFFAITSMIIHNNIIIAEEKFLEKRFGKEFENYKKRVRRYF